MKKQIMFKTIYLPKNKGLGNALKVALENCSNILVARMDSDDISSPDRFQMQLEYFIKNPKLDIVGGNITEFVGREEKITGRRVVPKSDAAIKKGMKRYCAMNHVTVMYKKDSVQRAGGYLDCPWNEDYYLWVRMMEQKSVFGNIPVDLVNVRTGELMSARRGGWKYFKSERFIQKYMLDHKLICLPRYFFNVIVRFMGEIIAPNKIRTLLFRFMRNKYIPVTNKKKVCKVDGTRYPSFSVAMSVYEKDNEKWLERALESIVIKQTVKPDEIIMVIDGPISQKIKNVIEKYNKICKDV